MADESLASVYATAMLDLAFSKGVHAEVLAELRTFRDVLNREGSFRDFLNTPSVGQEVKKGLITKVFGGQISDPTLNFFQIVLENLACVWTFVRVHVRRGGSHSRRGDWFRFARHGDERSDGGSGP